MISLRNISKSYDAVAAVKAVSFVVAKGEVHTIIGPSGCGKSTLLRCINLLEMPTSGALTVDGFQFSFGPEAPPPSSNALRQLRTRAGMVFQSYDLFQNLNALDNVTIGLRVVRKWERARAEDRGRQLLKKLGLSGRENYFPRQLSGGQAQRVAIARALAMEPAVILFDEVTAALDPELVKEVLSAMRQLAEEGYTMIIVTHEMQFARNVSNQVSFMHDGCIIESSAPAKLFVDPDHQQTRKFLSSLSM